MLTKGHLTRDEWNHLLRLFNIMNFLVFSCSHLLSIKKAEHDVEESSGKKEKRRACVSRNLSAKQSPSLDSGASYSWVNMR